MTLLFNSVNRAERTIKKIWIEAGYFESPHFVCVQCDYADDGIWSESGSAMRLDNSSVSFDLCARIEAWQIAFGKVHHLDEEKYCASEAHIAEAQAIAI